MADHDEQLVLAEDQRIRDALIVLRLTRPEDRDFAPLEALLVESEAAFLRAGFDEVWRGSVELNGRIDVLRQQTFKRSSDEIIVRSCERDWLHILELSPSAEPSTFRGNVGYVRAKVMLFRRDSTGRWRHAGSLQEALCPETRDVESVCDGFATVHGRP